MAPGLNAPPKNWQFLAYIVALIVAATMAWSNVKTTVDRHEAQIADQSKAIRETHDDVTTIKSDIGWIRRFLEQKQ